MTAAIHIQVPTYLPKFSIGKKIKIPTSLKKRSAESMICNMFILPSVETGVSAEILSVQLVNEHVDSATLNEVVSGFSLVSQDKRYYLLKNSRAYRVPDNWEYVFDRHPVDNNTPMQWVQIRHSQLSSNAGYVYHYTTQGYLPVSAISELRQHAPENTNLRIHMDQNCPLLQLEAPAKEPMVYLDDVFLSGDPNNQDWYTLQMIYHATHVLPSGGFAVTFRVRCPFGITDINDSSYYPKCTQEISRTLTQAYVQQLEQLAEYPALSYPEAKALWPSDTYPETFIRMAQLPKSTGALKSIRELLRTEEGVRIFEESIELTSKPSKSTVVSVGLLNSDEGYLALCHEGFRVFTPDRETNIMRHAQDETCRVVQHRAAAGHLRRLTSEISIAKALLLRRRNHDEVGHLGVSSGKLTDGRHYVSALLMMQSGWNINLNKNKFSLQPVSSRYPTETIACRILIVEHTLEACAQVLRETVQELAPTASVMHMRHREQKGTSDKALVMFEELSFNCTALATEQLKTILSNVTTLSDDTPQTAEQPLPM